MKKQQKLKEAEIRGKKVILTEGCPTSLVADSDREAIVKDMQRIVSYF